MLVMAMTAVPALHEAPDRRKRSCIKVLSEAVLHRTVQCPYLVRERSDELVVERYLSP